MTRMTGMNRPIGSIESFQALWIEISFVKNKNVICGVLYRQHIFSRELS